MRLFGWRAAPLRPGALTLTLSRRAVEGKIVVDEGVAVVMRVLVVLVGRPLAAPGPHPNPLPPSGRGDTVLCASGLPRLEGTVL